MFIDVSDMHLRKNKRLIFVLILPLVLIANCSLGQIRYFVQPTVSFPQTNLKYFLAASQDSIANDTLFQTLSREGYPLSYFRKIRTSVCFDNKCRLLKCVLYWNITGRYLGFELPKGEFLSKAEHKAFTPAEYERLGTLLADQLSPLGDLSYSELAPQTKTTTSSDGEVDGVSSATAKNVLEYVVEGAAYTTYKMWNVVYGPTQQDVMRLTSEALSEELVLQILQSPDLNDRMWALNHIRGNVKMTPKLRDEIYSLISDKNYNLAERVINALDANDLKSDTLQMMLVEKLGTTSYSIKKLIISKFREAPELSVPVKRKLAESLRSANGELVSNLLDTFAKHQVNDLETSRIVAELLGNQNAFISQKAFKYLEQSQLKDKDIERQMNEYRNTKR